ncbi:hypothetical protein [uncultured Polaribacter sp.]|uniref:hypothetical protein n=1 Tax=uncultured Polaribacter sp. TaxID=174711 RepID=UPI0026129EDD|nr:hypothetical protein [uncultured Polaribacter sp.]
MKTLIKSTALTAILTITTSLFISCNKQKTNTTKVAKNLSIKKNIDTNTTENITTKKPIVFITGYDKTDELFYTDARDYFDEKKFKIIEDQYSLEEIINWLNKNANDSIYGDIHIVNKSNPYKGMNLETVINGEKITSESLRENIIKGTLPILTNCVNSNSNIIFHANGLGENIELMNAFKDAFCTDELPNVIASPYYSIFSGEHTNHYLAKPFYVFYPTANSPGKIDLSKEIAKKYPKEQDIDWYDALHNEAERYIGEAYTTQFTIPVKFELDYHNSDNEIPTFKLQEEVMDFIENEEVLYTKIKKLNIPLEKFRWSWKIKNSALIIQGKTTGLVVLKPLIKPYGKLKHIKPDTKNKRLYAMK